MDSASASGQHEEDRVTDMIVKGGKALLPQGFVATDILVRDGKIARIAPSIEVGEGEAVVDARGQIVTAGLMDFHVHAFKYGHHIGLDIDELAPRTGVTTFVDSGSIGAIQFPVFRKFVIDQTPLNLFAYLNISVIGQTTSGISDLDFHDNDSRALIHLPVATEMIEKHRDVIKGIKVRVYTGMKDLYALEQARILADQVNLPILVHLGPAPPCAADTLALLRAGDVITHPYHGGEDTILDANRRIRPEFLDARERGVEVDLGMDRFHCDLRVMRRAFELGFFPDYVSTDLTLTNLNSITFDLPTTISKCVALGMPLEDALKRATTTVAKKLAVPGLSGQLEVGHTGDIAVFTWGPSDDPLVDFFGNSLNGEHRLHNTATVLQGNLLEHRTTDVKLWDSTARSVPWANYT
jgi:dihydroorotase